MKAIYSINISAVFINCKQIFHSKFYFFVGASQSGRRESHNVLENISEVDSQISNTSGGGTSKKDDGEFGKYEVSSAVAAISSMFPTVDESHIRDLLKK